MKYNLEILFDNVLNKAYKLRKANKTSFDGQGFWNPIKNMLTPLDSYHAKKWKKIPKSKINQIMILPEYTIDGNETKTIIENNHFIIQQVRIPLTEKPIIRKIVQLALNIGQYKGSSNFDKNLTYTDISQFLYKTDIMELSERIPDDIVEKINKYLSSL